MLSWNINNDIISCLAKFARDRLKEHISESTYYPIIADEVTERYSNKEVLLICLRYLRYIKEEPWIYETFLNSTPITGRSTGQTIGKIILEILENNGINVGGHPLSTYVKCSGKLTFLTPWYAHVRVLIRELEMLVFRKIFAYVLNGCPLADYAPLHKHIMVPKLWTVKFHV